MKKFLVGVLEFHISYRVVEAANEREATAKASEGTELYTEFKCATANVESVEEYNPAEFLEDN